MKLAKHYFDVFNLLFKKLDHSHLIVLEDDMIFSEDFLELFSSTVKFLNDKNENVFCISSWNDNGQSFLDHKHEMLYRTNYFPGLGMF